MRDAAVRVAVIAALLAGVGPRPASAQGDLNGFWQALNTAHWDLEPHEAGPGPVISVGP